MLSTVAGMVKLLNPVQLSKDELPIFVVVGGRMILVREDMFLKQESGTKVPCEILMVFSAFGMTKLFA